MREEEKTGNAIRAVIFDMDGTLTDTEKYYNRAWTEALSHFGYKVEPYMPLELRSLGRPFVFDKFRGWFGDGFDYHTVREYRKALVKDMIDREGLDLKPGAREILSFLKEKGIRSAIATANPLDRTMRLLDKVGLQDLFDTVICADMVTQGKPAPDIYSYAVSELGLQPSETFAVEDSPNGVTSAYRAGCNVIMVPDLTEPDDELSKMLYARVDTLADIKDLL